MRVIGDSPWTYGRGEGRACRDGFRGAGSPTPPETAGAPALDGRRICFEVEILGLRHGTRQGARRTA